MSSVSRPRVGGDALSSVSRPLLVCNIVPKGEKKIEKERRKEGKKERKRKLQKKRATSYCFCVFLSFFLLPPPIYSCSDMVEVEGHGVAVDWAALVAGLVGRVEMGLVARVVRVKECRRVSHQHLRSGAEKSSV